MKNFKDLKIGDQILLIQDDPRPYMQGKQEKRFATVAEIFEEGFAVAGIKWNSNISFDWNGEALWGNSPQAMLIKGEEDLSAFTTRNAPHWIPE